MSRLLPVLLALALALAACGGGDGGTADERAVKEVVKTWLLDGECDLMTDRFLATQLLGLGNDRPSRCELFEKQHQRPRYSEDQIEISDVRVTGTRATLVVGQEGIDVESRYSLVKTGGRWRIDAADLQ
jgi:hypothetical protein